MLSFPPFYFLSPLLACVLLDKMTRYALLGGRGLGSLVSSGGWWEGDHILGTYIQYTAETGIGVGWRLPRARMWIGEDERVKLCVCTIRTACGRVVPSVVR